MNTEIERQEELLLLRKLKDFSKRELDEIIAEAYYALVLAEEGSLNLGGVRVLPKMNTWGERFYGEDGYEVCYACLAGCLFIKRTGSLLLEENLNYILREEDEGTMNIMTFLDSLRCLYGEWDVDFLSKKYVLDGYKTLRRNLKGLSGYNYPISNLETAFQLLEALMLDNPSIMKRLKTLSGGREWKWMPPESPRAKAGTRT